MKIRTTTLTTRFYRFSCGI